MALNNDLCGDCPHCSYCIDNSIHYNTKECLSLIDNTAINLHWLFKIGVQRAVNQHKMSGFDKFIYALSNVFSVCCHCKSRFDCAGHIGNYQTTGDILIAEVIEASLERFYHCEIKQEMFIPDGSQFENWKDLFNKLVLRK